MLPRPAFLFIFVFGVEGCGSSVVFVFFFPRGEVVFAEEVSRPPISFFFNDCFCFFPVRVRSILAQTLLVGYHTLQEYYSYSIYDRYVFFFFSFWRELMAPCPSPFCFRGGGKERRGEEGRWLWSVGVIFCRVWKVVGVSRTPCATPSQAQAWK